MSSSWIFDPTLDVLPGYSSHKVCVFAVGSCFVRKTGYGDVVYPDDTGKDLATVLSYLTGRTLIKEDIGPR